MSNKKREESQCNVISRSLIVAYVIRLCSMSNKKREESQCNVISRSLIVFVQDDRVKSKTLCLAMQYK